MTRKNSIFASNNSIVAPINHSLPLNIPHHFTLPILPWDLKSCYYISAFIDIISVYRDFF